MPTIWRCAIFFLLWLGTGYCQGYAQETSTLERITVVKRSKEAGVYSRIPEEMGAFSSSTVAPLLQYLPIAIQSRSLPADIQSDFSLRGSTFQGVLMLVDGHRVNDPQTAHHNSDIPLTREDIQAVEVLPGVGSSLFGSDAIGGAVNIVLKKPDANRVVIETHGGSFRTSGGLASITRSNNRAGLRLTLGREVSGGFHDDTDNKRSTANVASYVNLPRGTFDTFFGYSQKEFGAFDFYTPGRGFPSKEWTKTLLLQSGCDLAGDTVRIKPHVLWRRHYDIFMLDKTQVRSKYLNHHRTDMVTPSVYASATVQTFGTVGVGAEYGDERIVSTNLGTHSRSHASIFADETWDQGSVFIPSWSARFDNFDSFGAIATGLVSLKKTFGSGITNHIAVVRAARIPSFTELYYNDPVTTGDVHLKPETALGIETGFQRRLTRWSYGSTLFFRREQDILNWVKHTPSQAKWQAENISQADVRGIEAYGTVAISTYIDITSNYTYVDKNMSDGGLLFKYGPSYTRHLWHALITLRLPFGVQSFGFTYKKEPTRGGWPLFEIGLSHGLGPRGEVFVNVTNLLDKSYEEIPGIPYAGRAVDAGLRFVW